jgi:hypothetical protein
MPYLIESQEGSLKGTRVLDIACNSGFWSIQCALLGAVVLNLGFLYHLPKPLEALELTKIMARKHLLLDTAVHPSDDFAIHLKWEEPSDIRMAVDEGIVSLPTKPGVELMLRHLKVNGWFEIPVLTRDMPVDYLTGRRASWLIEV